MYHAELTSELRASRGWVLTMAILALAFCALWCLMVVAGWVMVLSGKTLVPPLDGPGWASTLQSTWMAQLCLVILASPIAFVSLLRYANSLGELRDGDEASLLRALELNRTFWRQACWLGWGAAWLVVYLFGGGMLGMLLWGK